jgi:hypothetical protein
MPPSNYERLIKLAEDVFDMRNDLEQLQVDENVIEQLKRIHASTVSEFSDENGPVAWLLVIPTTHNLMEKFIAKEISEKQLFELTSINSVYETIYLCSALPLFKRTGH